VTSNISLLTLFLLILFPAMLLFPFKSGARENQSEFQASIQESASKLEKDFVSKLPADQRQRALRGISQAAQFWRQEDGGAAQFEEFVRSKLIIDPKILDQTFNRLEATLEQLDGHMSELSRAFREQVDLDRGPIHPVDEILSGYDPSAHVAEDFFKNKLAFLALLNFPLTTLEQRLAGENWSRREWAEARLAQRFSRRVPGDVNLAVSHALAEADRYISEYNIWMHHLLDEEGNRLFPAKLRLISHWNLRDELKADYSEPNGIAKQRMIEKVMERIVTQTIPAAVVNNPHVDWKPFSNQVLPAGANDADSPAPSNLKISTDPEPDTRYAMLLKTFQASRKVDPYSPTAPTLIDRRFNEDREIPEARVKEMFEKLLTSPVAPKVASLIEKRLGRKLEPFDIWYNGFKARGKYSEQELDAIVSKKYPSADAYAADIPNLLQKLGFSKERAKFLASNIVVDPSRGAGHAWGAERREDKAHLRTRVEQAGMNYKGYNIAIHEMGHNVEQTISLQLIDHTLLSGVPNTAFTEALAFVFQARDLELLGLSRQDETSSAMQKLATFWNAFEIAGVALVDMGVWHWMYDHPDATPAQLKEATIQISRDIWNRFYAPIFGEKDVVLLGIYSHMIDSQLYLPDYPIGHMIALQIEEQIDQSGNLGAEFERMCKTGSVVPDLWMKTATGAPVGPEAMLRAAEKSLSLVQ
jgi:hypothetical protein